MPHGDDPDPLIGQTLGEFELAELIGRGGMGAVYKARQPSLERFVAIKVLPPALSADEAYVARFAREARAAAAVSHRHIIGILEIGQTGDHRYIAMEHVDGESLAAILERDGRLSQGRALVAMKQAAAALAAAHKAGIVHRDIKPSNLLIDTDGELRVSDFGLARQLGTEKTTGSAPLGTPAYVAPEMALGKPVDVRTDLYSLGATFFHALAGRPPFEGESFTDVLLKQINEPAPPLADVAADVDPRLCDIIARLLRKDPAERPASAQALLEDLEALGELPPTAAAPGAEGRDLLTKAPTLTMGAGRRLSLRAVMEARQRRGTRKTTVLAASAATVLAAVGLTLWAVSTPPQTVSTPPQTIFSDEHSPEVGTPKRPETALPEAPSDLRAVPPDQSVSLFNGKTLAGWRRVEQFPVGSKLGSGKGGRAHVENGQIVLSDGDPCAGIAWSGRFPTNDYEITLEAKRIAGVADFAAIVFPIERSHCMLMLAGWYTVVALDMVDGRQGCQNITTRRMSFEDGRWYHVRLRVTRMQVQVWLDEAEVIGVPIEGHKFELRKWFWGCRPFGVRTWGTTAALRNIRFRRIEPAAEPRKERVDFHCRVLTTLRGHSRWVVAVAFSPDGTRVATGSQDNTARLWDAANWRCLHTLRDHQGWVESVAFSPDGKRLITASMDRMVRIWDAATGDCLKVLEGHTDAAHAAFFLPDGRRAVSAGGDGTVRIWDVATGKCLQTLTDPAGRMHVQHMDLSADGKRIATCGHDEMLRLWDAETGAPLRKVHGGSRKLWCVALSPDGERVATVGNDPAVKVWNTATGQLLRRLGTPRLNRGLAFSPGGNWIAAGLWHGHVHFWDAETYRFARCVVGHRATVFRVAFSPDGKRLVSVGFDRTAKVWALDRVAQPPQLPGRRGERWALEFDGRSSHVSIPTLRYDGTHPITVEAIVMPQVSRRVVAVVGDTQEAGASIDLAGSYWAFQAHYGGRYVRAVSDRPAVTGEAAHVAGVLDGQRVSLFVNGKRQRVAPAINGRFRASRMPMTVGASPGPGPRGFDHPFHGIIHSVRISKTVRYAGDFAPPDRFASDRETMLLLHLDEGEGTVARDSSGNGHHGTIKGAKWVEPDEDGKKRPEPPPPPAPKRVYAKGVAVLKPLWGKRQFAEALTKAKELAKAKEYAVAPDAARGLVEDAAALAGFWEAARGGAAKLKPGDPFRMRGMLGKVTKVEDGRIHLKVGGAEFAKKLAELSDAELVALARKARPLTTGTDLLALALLHLHGKKPDAKRAEAALLRAAKVGVDTSRHQVLLKGTGAKPAERPPARPTPGAQTGTVYFKLGADLYTMDPDGSNKTLLLADLKGEPTGGTSGVTSEPSRTVLNRSEFSGLSLLGKRSGTGGDRVFLFGVPPSGGLARPAQGRSWGLKTA